MYIYIPPSLPPALSLLRALATNPNPSLPHPQGLRDIILNKLGLDESGNALCSPPSSGGPYGGHAHGEY